MISRNWLGNHKCHQGSNRKGGYKGRDWRSHYKERINSYKSQRRVEYHKEADTNVQKGRRT